MENVGADKAIAFNNDNEQRLNTLIADFSPCLNWLNDYDHKKDDNEKSNALQTDFSSDLNNRNKNDIGGKTVRNAVVISLAEFLAVTERMKTIFRSDVFANPKDDGFARSVNQIYQTFGGKDLYPSLEEKAAMLLYLIVKNHSFSDGNKRIGAVCFLYFLDKNGLLYNDCGKAVIDNETLFSLIIFIAESDQKEKEKVKQIAVSILNRGGF